jgi:hypothetical protein
MLLNAAKCCKNAGKFFPDVTAEELLRIYIKEIFIKYRVLAKIILDKDRKFILRF